MANWAEQVEMQRYMEEARLRELYIAYANQFPDHFLTLASKVCMPVSEFRNRVSEFHKQLDRKLLGRSAYKKPLHQRTSGIMFLEQITAHIHGHALVRFAGDKSTSELRDMCAAIWTKLCPGGTISLQEQYGDGPAGYATKEMERWGYDDLQQVILFRDLVSR